MVTKLKKNVNAYDFNFRKIGKHVVDAMHISNTELAFNKNSCNKFLLKKNFFWGGGLQTDIQVSNVMLYTCVMQKKTHIHTGNPII